MTFKPMPILTVLSLASLVILILLGNWQYARYSEKIAMPAQTEQIDVAEVYRVEIDRSQSGNVQQVYGFADGEPIWRRYAPGQIVGTGEPVLVMVEATGGPEPVPAAIAELPDTVALEGILAAKVANESVFNAQDNPEADQWYRLDPAGMSARLGIVPVPPVLEPVIMTVRNAASLDQARQTPNPYAFSKPLDPLPPERHFGYALTWWGMALGLIGVYLALHRARGRLKF
ncbi:MAG: SURF1 family cytochrome oxidase biogenesis protein [Pseudomonadota bacterium]